MQKIIDQPKLQAFIKQYGITPDFQKFLDSWNIQKRYKYANLSSATIFQICRRIEFRIDNMAESSAWKDNDLWIKGQYKLYIWVSAFYSFHLQLAWNQFKNSDFQFLASIFLTKSVERMKYELKNLTTIQRCSRKRWNQKEIQLLKQILKKYQSKNKKLEWKSIAFELFCKSEGESFRTFGQCREMWTNHLNETVSKRKWTVEQDELLLKLVQEHSKKWAKISQKIGGMRSGHMIKNRYRVILKRQAKRLQELTDMKELDFNHSLTNAEQNQALDINPNVLTAFSLIQSQNGATYHYRLQQERIAEPTQEPPAQKLENGPASYSTWTVNKDIQPKISLVDYDFTHMSKLFNENNLLQQLGCAHFQQIQFALQQQPEIRQEMEQ